jgi:hypothetical protein
MQPKNYDARCHEEMSLWLFHVHIGRNHLISLGKSSLLPAITNQDLTLVFLKVSRIVVGTFTDLYREWPCELLKFLKFLIYWNMNKMWCLQIEKGRWIWITNDDLLKVKCFLLEGKKRENILKFDDYVTCPMATKISEFLSFLTAALISQELLYH